jgi:hypothetical protein
VETAEVDANRLRLALGPVGTDKHDPGARTSVRPAIAALDELELERFDSAIRMELGECRHLDLDLRAAA